MALGDIIRFRTTTSFKRRAKRVARVEFNDEANMGRKMSALGRKALIEYVERREIELGLVPQPKQEIAA